MVPYSAPLPEPLPQSARERVVDILTRHFVSDDLTDAEFEDRLQRVSGRGDARSIVRITGRAVLGFAECVVGPPP